MNKKFTFKYASLTAALNKIHEIRKEYIRVLFANALLQAIRPFIPIILSAKILDELMTNQDKDRLILLVIMLVGFMLISHIISSYFTKRYNDESKMLVNHYYFSLSKKCMSMDYGSIEENSTRELLGQIEGAGNSFMAIWNIAEYMQKGLLAIIEILIAGFLIMTMFINGSKTLAIGNSFIQSPFSFVLLLGILLTGLYLYSILQGKLGQTAANDMKGHVMGNRIFGYLFFYMASNYENGKDIRLYKAQNLLHSKMKKFVEGNYYECDEHFVKPNIKHYSLLSIVNVVMLVAVYIFIILKAYVGAITVGTIFIQINAIMRLYDALGSFLKQFNMLKASCEHFQYTIDFFNLPEAHKEGTIAVQKSNQYVFEFKDVSFKYPSSDQWVLSHVNMTIRSGEKLAVVGMNGAGKTTMIKLLCRLYNPTEGIITLNGIDIKDFIYEEYINLFSVVFQDFKLFAFGLDQNISLGKAYDEKNLKETLIQSGLKDLVEEINDLTVSLGKNFDEDGRDFSGGEKQKIAIARALYKDAPIVVLDEPTAALDPLAEFEIYSKFNTLVKDKAAVFISHRLSSCRFCHKILVFDQGKIVQMGDHDYLLSKNEGKYYDLWQAQAQHYVYD